MEYLPDVYQHFERAFPHVHSAHQDLAKACYEGGPLDERAARLVKLGIALGAQAEGAVRYHARRALTEGESRGEVRHVGLLALTTIGFPHTIAGLSWIEEVIEATKPRGGEGEASGPVPERPFFGRSLRGHVAFLANRDSGIRASLTHLNVDRHKSNVLPVAGDLRARLVDARPATTKTKSSGI